MSELLFDDDGFIFSSENSDASVQLRNKSKEIAKICADLGTRRSCPFYLDKQQKAEMRHCAWANAIMNFYGKKNWEWKISCDDKIDASQRSD